MNIFQTVSFFWILSCRFVYLNHTGHYLFGWIYISRYIFLGSGMDSGVFCCVVYLICWHILINRSSLIYMSSFVQSTAERHSRHADVSPPLVRILIVLDACTRMHYTVMWACAPESWVGKFVVFPCGYPDRELYVCKNAHRDQRIVTFDDAMRYLNQCCHNDVFPSGSVVALIVFLLREYESRKSFDHIPDTINVESIRTQLL